MWVELTGPLQQPEYAQNSSSPAEFVETLTGVKPPSSAGAHPSSPHVTSHWPVHDQAALAAPVDANKSPENKSKILEAERSDMTHLTTEAAWVST